MPRRVCWRGFFLKEKAEGMKKDRSSVNGDTVVTGIFGDPIRHTLSPVIHNTISRLTGENQVYVPFHVEKDIGKAVAGAWSMGIRGLNVTVPYKQQVMPHLARIDDTAREIGAVNTLVRGRDGFEGFNTDTEGVFRALQDCGVSPVGKSAVLIGAGGASRAVAHALLTHGIEKIWLLNRTLSRAEEVAEMSSRIVPLAAEQYTSVPKGKYLFFQCTSLGLKQEDGLLIRDSAFYDMAEFGFDLIYNPAETPFLKVMKEKGVPCCNGLGMLLWQGIASHEMWTGRKVAAETAFHTATVLKRALYGENIILTGYMGAGKTSAAKAVSAAAGKTYIDTDAEIEEKTGKKISAIFRESGEAGFRDLETRLLRHLSDTAYNSVIATGGGVPLRAENRRMLQETGTVVFLDASPAEITKRVAGDENRPLLQRGNGETLENHVRNMLEKRMPSYLAGCDFKVKTDGKTPEDVAAEILRNISCS